MYQFWKLPYGSDAKPHSLQDIPWEYVNANRDRIPFLGLREYWYPALESGDLRNNQLKAITLAGDPLVFFRDATGTPRALANRCPHRGALLSLGQVGVFEPGTITCRYHGMTFDGAGTCVAFLTDGPDSPACGNVTARAYPVEERAGIIWVYMGSKEPRPVEKAIPHAAEVLDQKKLIVLRIVFPYSYLNQIDNGTDLAHVAVLHRNCILFADQKSYGAIEADEVPEGGILARFATPHEHPGRRNIDRITLYLPGFVYNAPGEMGMVPDAHSYFWFVPRDIGSFEGWLMIGASAGRRFNAVQLISTMFGPLMRNTPGADCIYGGDGPIQMSQGRIVRWDQDHLTRTDRAIVKARRLFERAHRAELAERDSGPR
jgi:phenylpropionate dioxygenase-like ring-hydroxylating dioxygenase large terminal subunit